MRIVVNWWRWWLYYSDDDADNNDKGNNHNILWKILNLSPSSPGEVDHPGELALLKLWKKGHHLSTFLASPDAQEVMWVSESVCHSLCLSGLADLTDVTDGTCVTHDHLSSVIESILLWVMIPLEDSDYDDDDFLVMKII